MTARMKPLKRRPLEMAAAAAIGLFAAAIIHGSLRLKTGWSATGPESGYFPLRLGILLGLASLGLFLQAWRASGGQVFATREQLGRSLRVFLPTVMLVAAMPFIGCYLAGAMYVLYMARVEGGLRWVRAIATAATSMAVFFLVFELWFQVPLIKGPVEAWLGLS